MNGKALTFPLSSKAQVEPNPPLPFALTLDFAKSPMYKKTVLVEGENAEAQGAAAWNEGDAPLSIEAGSAGKDSWHGTSNAAD